jgi:RNA polymerase sigma-70 factor (ECF subfamily)
LLALATRDESGGPVGRRIARFEAEILAFLRRRVGDDAEEVAQETWLRVAAARPNCPDDAAFRAFAFTVARRLLIDRHRRAAARPVHVALEEAPDAADPAEEVSASQAMAAVESELARMKPEIAEVFRMRTSSDLSFKEIADRQGVPVNTALGRMHQATKRLAAALTAMGLLPGGEE